MKMFKPIIVITILLFTGISTCYAENILIVYFSRVGISESFAGVDAVSSASLPDGNTIILAEMIHDQVGGDMHQIITKKLYPAKYRDTTDLAKVEQNNNERPELKNQVDDWDRYDTVFIGYPNWWGTLPMPVFTFIEQYDFNGKTIIPFCTHEGSRLGGSVRDLEKSLSGTEILEGFEVRGGRVNQAERGISKWLDELGY